MDEYFSSSGNPTSLVLFSFLISHDNCEQQLGDGHGAKLKLQYLFLHLGHHISDVRLIVKIQLSSSKMTERNFI